MKEKTPGKKVKGVAYAYAGELLKIWYENMMVDVSYVAEEAAKEIPELEGQSKLVELCIRDAFKDVYTHASAYTELRFSLEFEGLDDPIPDVVRSVLN